MHLELSTTEAWQCGNFLDPLAPLGIPNVRGTIVEYDDTAPDPPTPTPTPTPTGKSNSNKWLKRKAKKLIINY